RLTLEARRANASTAVDVALVTVLHAVAASRRLGVGGGVVRDRDGLPRVGLAGHEARVVGETARHERQRRGTSPTQPETAQHHDRSLLPLYPAASAGEAGGPRAHDSNVLPASHTDLQATGARSRPRPTSPLHHVLSSTSPSGSSFF